MKRIVVAGVLAALGLVVPSAALAQTGGATKKDPNAMDMKGMPMTSMDMKNMGTDKNATGTHQGVGVVKSVNTQDGGITIAHEPIKSLAWPAMTMSFKVKDKGLVEKIKPGDKVKFTLVQAGKDYVLTDVR